MQCNSFFGINNRVRKKSKIFCTFEETIENMAGGRPMIWKDPIELSNLIADYFNSTERPTLAGLAVFLEIDRQTLYNYKERDEFFDIIKKATAKVESIYEERAIYDNNPTGVIFALKNMGWKDRTDITTNDKEMVSPPIKWENE